MPIFMKTFDCILQGSKYFMSIIQLLTIELLIMMLYPAENTNIDRGDSRGQY